MTNEIIHMDVTRMAELIAKREISPVEIVRPISIVLPRSIPR